MSHLVTQRVTRGKRILHPCARIQKRWPADMVLLAIGYTGPESALAEALDLDLDNRTALPLDTFMTSEKDSSAAGMPDGGSRW